MIAPHWPAWLWWLMLVAVFLTFIFALMIVLGVAGMRQKLTNARALAPAQNRNELEERYVAGAISRDQYDVWKERLR